MLFQIVTGLFCDLCFPDACHNNNPFARNYLLVPKRVQTSFWTLEEGHV
ncbi:hypothetical protein [Prochlorococcus marinus]|nr:hypothetical protein [Prochlorococcus marinus]MBO8203608.1 hypothetical protein [Prochlorococcus marinus CUG1415]